MADSMLSPSKHLKPKSGSFDKKRGENAHVVAQSKAKFTEPGSVEEREYLQNLMKQFGDVDSDYMEYVKKQEPYSQNKAVMKQKFSGMSGIYYRQMMLTCMSPLQDGLDLNSLVQCVSMYVGMSLMDKDFKNQMKNMANQFEYQIVSKKAEKDGPNSKAAVRATELKQLMTMHNNGGREPFNPRSAALTKIAMTTKAYSDMRVPGADIDKIRSAYTEAMGVLDEQIGDDGLRVSAVNQEMRTIVGQMSNQDPSIATMFRETSYDGVVKAPYHKDPNNPNQVIWTGEYFDRNGKMFTGGFTPREPLTVESAAEIKYNMAVDAYKNMRSGNMTVDEVEAWYQSSMDVLSKMCDVDCINELAVNKKLRQKVGQMSAKDPFVNNMFVETAFGLVGKAPGVRDTNNPNRAIWSGEYQTRDGQIYNDAFTPRPPMSADMAAQLKVQVILHTYDAMRASDADVKACMQDYKNTMSALDKQCGVDKLNSNEINQSMRIIVGDMCEQDPAMAVVFKELSYDGIEKASAFVDSHGNEHWTGEYVKPNGMEFDGGFNPRAPQSYKKNMGDIKMTIDSSFASVQDEHDLHDVMRGYSAAYYQIVDDVEPDDSVKKNVHYRDTVMLMRMAMDDGADAAKFETDVTKMFQTAYQNVPKDIVAAYKKEYVSSKSSGEPRTYSERGSEHDDLRVDKSAKGRGLDAARRLGVVDCVDSQSGFDVDYNPS